MQRIHHSESLLFSGSAGIKVKRRHRQSSLVLIFMAGVKLQCSARHLLSFPVTIKTNFFHFRVLYYLSFCCRYLLLSHFLLLVLFFYVLTSLPSPFPLHLCKKIPSRNQTHTWNTYRYFQEIINTAIPERKKLTTKSETCGRTVFVCACVCV